MSRHIERWLFIAALVVLSAFVYRADRNARSAHARADTAMVTAASAVTQASEAGRKADEIARNIPTYIGPLSDAQKRTDKTVQDFLSLVDARVEPLKIETTKILDTFRDINLQAMTRDLQKASIDRDAMAAEIQALKSK